MKALAARFGSLRYRLLVLVVVPLVLLAGTVILLAARWSTDYSYRLLLSKVNTDLSVAQDAFERLQSDALARLANLATDPALVAALLGDRRDVLDARLATTARRGGFDRLTLFDAAGGRRLQDGTWQSRPARSGVLIERALRVAERGEGAVGVERVEERDWRDELDAGQVVIALVDTPRAAPDARAVAGAVEDRALLVRAVQPIVAADGRRIGLLDGDVLLNRNLAFVDAIRDLVYGPGSLAPGSRGTVTLFLDDVRVSTNVPTLQERRALGTRVSAEVRQHVLGAGLTWTARAFVVNDWYVSGYEPLLDAAGQRIGMLYAGFSDAPFRADLRRAISVLAVLSIAGCGLAALTATLGARAIFRPVERMASVARATAAGRHRRIGTLDAPGELKGLGQQFDAMLDALEAQRARIEDDARSLERKVAERTDALEERNTSLQESLDLLRQTRAQLATAERLAALGELTAGVAHEINNPTAVILGNLDILVEEIGTARDGVQVEIDLIVDQVFRIRSITDRLLAWSRKNVVAPGAPDAPRTTASVAALVADALALMQHELLLRDVAIVEEHVGRLQADIDPQELLQVLVNLMQNALEASDASPPSPLTIALRSRAGSGERSGEVIIDVEDDGPGIDADSLSRLFDPFFTANKPGGTGLGLSVSHGIVDRAGGRIEVASQPGCGARFTIVLPRVAGG